jgi:6-phosphogluconolactonase
MTSAGAGMEPGNGRGQGEPELVVVQDAEAASGVAAERIAEALKAAVAARGVAHWSTTGGSTPGAIYRQLAGPAFREAVPWDRVHLWWGDDRWVPDTDVLSNAIACWDLLVTSVPVPHDQVHAMPIGRAMAEGRPASWAASVYADELRAAGLPLDGAGFPVLDIVLVGIGSDGHVFSVFPGSPTWDDPAWAQAVPAPAHIAPHVERVTLHPRILAAARLPLVVAHGPSKTAVVGRVFGLRRHEPGDEAGPQREDERALPALLARRSGAVWILDEAAAAGIPARLRGRPGGAPGG